MAKLHRHHDIDRIEIQLQRAQQEGTCQTTFSRLIKGLYTIVHEQFRPLHRKLENTIESFIAYLRAHIGSFDSRRRMRVVTTNVMGAIWINTSVVVPHLEAA